MTDRGILFSAPMVRAILAGRKTQTRRICKPQPVDVFGCHGRRIYRDQDFKKAWEDFPGSGECDGFRDSPYGQPGDRLWVRERSRCYAAQWGAFATVEYQADGKEIQHAWPGKAVACSLRWRPSILMPRWASRITLEITGIRVERLQEISEADALAEGIEVGPREDWQRRGPIHAYMQLWDSIHGDGATYANPWVWVVKFRRVA